MEKNKQKKGERLKNIAYCATSTVCVGVCGFLCSCWCEVLFVMLITFLSFRLWKVLLPPHGSVCGRLSQWVLYQPAAAGVCALPCWLCVMRRPGFWRLRSVSQRWSRPLQRRVSASVPQRHLPRQDHQRMQRWGHFAFRLLVVKWCLRNEKWGFSFFFL